MGINELLLSSALLFDEFDDVCYLMFESARATLKQKGMLSQNITNYLLDLQKFITMRKKNPLTKTEKVISATFKYDFEAIQKAEYLVNPNSLPLLEAPLQFKFYHDKQQQKHISNQFKLYSNQPNGLGKMIKESDIRNFFRHFSRSH